MMPERRQMRLGVTPELLADMFLARKTPLVLRPPVAVPPLDDLEIVGVDVERPPLFVQGVEPKVGTVWVTVSHPSFDPVPAGECGPAILVECSDEADGTVGVTVKR